MKLKHFSIWTLRVLVFLGFIFPLFAPEKRKEDHTLKTSLVTILKPEGYLPSATQKALIQQTAFTLFQKSSERETSQLSFAEFASQISYSWEEYAFSPDVLPSIESLYSKILLRLQGKNLTIALVDTRVWGAEEALLRKKLGSILERNDIQTKHDSSRFAALPIELEKNLQSSVKIEQFLALNDVYLPKNSFLGEESLANLDFKGRTKSGEEKIVVRVIAKSEDGILAEKEFSLVSKPNGLVSENIPFPIVFLKPGAQSIWFEVSQSGGQENDFRNQIPSGHPLLSVTKTAQVLHSKTTILHVGVSPDWNIRSLRQKFKFHPSLDLISYFILRDFTDNLNIPPEELSLIEFPSQKLFGSELENFHGIVAQNFNFEQYMNPTDTKNILDYIRAGGRLLLVAGPNIFGAKTQELESLLPCENSDLKLNSINSIQWEANDVFDSEKESEPKQAQSEETSSVSQSGVDSDLYMQLGKLSSHETYLGCKPKKNTLVFARDTLSKSPLVLSSSFGKGIVLTILAADFANTYPTSSLAKPSEKYAWNEEKEAKEYLTQWAVEFVQRRQDGGKRPPLLRGPRHYSNSVSHSVAVQGSINFEEGIFLKMSSLALDSSQKKNSQNFKSTSEAWTEHTLAEYKPLDLLTINHTTKSNAENFNSSIKMQYSQSAETLQIPRMQLTNVELKFGNEGVVRQFTVPLFEGSRLENESLPNPALVDFLASAQKNLESSEESKSKASVSSEIFKKGEMIPFLKAYPFYLALVLAFLFLERLLSFVWGKRQL